MRNPFFKFSKQKKDLIKVLRKRNLQRFESLAFGHFEKADHRSLQHVSCRKHGFLHKWARHRQPPRHLLKRYIRNDVDSRLLACEQYVPNTRTRPQNRRLHFFGSSPEQIDFTKRFFPANCRRGQKDLFCNPKFKVLWLYEVGSEVHNGPRGYQRV